MGTNTAIITGASAGLGREYVKALVNMHPEIDEFWLIARRRDKMEQLAKDFDGKRFEIIALDLSDKASFDEYSRIIAEKKPSVKLLINNAGYGKLGDFDKLDCNEQYGMVDVNVRALVAMSRLTLDYMDKGSAIINVCSIAAFVPNPRMAVYCSTKAFVFSFSKALRQELKSRGINVLAVCPGPMETEFLAVANIPKGASPLFDSIPRVDPSVIAKRSIKRAFDGKAVYTNKFLFKLYRVLGKLIPHNWLMWKLTA